MQRKSNAPIALAGVVLYGLMATMYVDDHKLYMAVLNAFSFTPLDIPFIDTTYFTAQTECWRRGIDVYTVNPCDPLGRLHDYAPIWLRIPGLTTDRQFVFAVGIGQGLLFLACLLALPASRSWAAMIAIGAGVFAPVTVFALERGNPDLAMFVLATITIVLLDRAPTLRLLGYASAVVAATLKFYPFVLMGLLTRERLGRAIAIGLAGSVVFFGSILLFKDEVLRMLPHVPRPSVYQEAFGAKQIGRGWADIAAVGDSMLASFLTIALLALAAVLAVLLGRNQEFRLRLTQLTPREADCLLAGSLLMVGCFLVGSSIAYRAIFLLFVIPGLLAMASGSPSRVGALLRMATIACVGVMWFQPIQRLVYHAFGMPTATYHPVVSTVFWAVREGCWWGIMTVLGAVLARALMDWLGVVGSVWKASPTTIGLANE